MTHTNNIALLPKVGEVLKFAMDCFNLNRSEAGLNYKQVQRLASGKDIKPETYRAVATQLLNSLYSHVSSGDENSADEIISEWQNRGGIDQNMPLSANGFRILNQDQFLRDSLEFFYRINDLNIHLSDVKRSRVTLYVWLIHFVFPYLSSTYVDYVLAENNPDAGMPGGDLWILPSKKEAECEVTKSEWIWPTQKVLLWWEDLLGSPLVSMWDKLAGAASYDTALREVNHWKNGRTFDASVVERWATQSWTYSGTFEDNAQLPLSIRWHECKVFLIGKGFDRNPTALGEQILGIPGIAFSAFFDSVHPVWDGLPIERLINQVSIRWQTPTNKTLRARMLIARASNRAWKESSRYFDETKFRSLMGSFAWLYNHYMKICSSAEIYTMDERWKLHQQLAVNEGQLFSVSAGVMFNETAAAYLPIEIRKLIEGLGRIKRD